MALPLLSLLAALNFTCAQQGQQHTVSDDQLQVPSRVEMVGDLASPARDASLETVLGTAYARLEEARADLRYVHAAANDVQRTGLYALPDLTPAISAYETQGRVMFDVSSAPVIPTSSSLADRLRGFSQQMVYAQLQAVTGFQAARYGVLPLSTGNDTLLFRPTDVDVASMIATLDTSRELYGALLDASTTPSEIKNGLSVGRLVFDYSSQLASDAYGFLREMERTDQGDSQELTELGVALQGYVASSLFQENIDKLRSAIPQLSEASRGQYENWLSFVSTLEKNIGTLPTYSGSGN